MNNNKLAKCREAEVKNIKRVTLDVNESRGAGNCSADNFSKEADVKKTKGKHAPQGREVLTQIKAFGQRALCNPYRDGESGI